jgi:hypothetical protein
MSVGPAWRPSLSASEVFRKEMFLMMIENHRMIGDRVDRAGGGREGRAA